MSIKNTLKRDLKWFQTYGLIKRTFITLLMTLIEMYVLAILNFWDNQIMAIGIISFIGFFFIVYLFFAWVFSDVKNLEENNTKIVNELNDISSNDNSSNDNNSSNYLPIIITMVLLVVGIFLLNIYSNNKKEPKVDTYTETETTPVAPAPAPEYYTTPQTESEGTNPYIGGGDLFETEKFKIGSTKDDVRRIQGEPSGVSKWEFNNTEYWNYGLSSVTFKRGKVKEYSNLGHNLKVKYE
jgi:hypothetical protein